MSGRVTIYMYVIWLLALVGSLTVVAIQSNRPRTRRIAAAAAIFILLASALFVAAVAWYFSHWDLRF
jgi:hypothetical protein